MGNWAELNSGCDLTGMLSYLTLAKVRVEIRADTGG